MTVPKGEDPRKTEKKQKEKKEKEDNPTHRQELKESAEKNNTKRPTHRPRKTNGLIQREKTWKKKNEN